MADGRQNHAVVADLDGALLTTHSSSFPYFMLLAVEAGSLLRGLALLLLSPLILLLQAYFSESAAIHLLVFVSVAGVPIRDVERVARVVLPRFYAADVRADAWRVFKSCGGRRVVVTATPAVMVGPFVREFLGVDTVVGTGLEVDRRTGKATGFVRSPGVLVGRRKREVVEERFAAEEEEEMLELGLGGVGEDCEFISLCKEAYMVHPDPHAAKASPDDLDATAIFHDGRFVRRPDPLHALLLFLWLPLGFLLSLLRIFLFLSLPPRLALLSLRLTGVRLLVHGTPPSPTHTTTPSQLFVLNHRNNLDPIFVGLALGRRLPCVTYKLNRLFQLLSPIPTKALSRGRDADAARISYLLSQGDLAMCPEGTTSREPYLLRFSALFAELSSVIVPVAINTKQTMFHGTTFFGSKIMDPIFFFMNPNCTYEVTFLERLHEKHTCKGGRSRIEVANHVQKVLGEKLGAKCTTLARKDKYLKLGGEDGYADSFLSLKKG